LIKKAIFQKKALIRQRQKAILIFIIKLTFSNKKYCF
jgi:hypothetical protein